MRATPRIQHALSRAVVLHDGQYRKDSATPYIVHPISVAMILGEYTDDEDVIVAALLHDVLEDVAGYYEHDMREEFGDRVTDIVKGVTEPKDPNKPRSERLPWREIKERYLKNLENAPIESVMVAAADKIHNLRSFIEIIEQEGERTWEIFNSTPEERIWYFEKVIAVITDRLSGGLVRHLQENFSSFQLAIATTE
ncbi:MAG: HD domain-containing protein [Candidatus Paceibacterota bacterium]